MTGSGRARRAGLAAVLVAATAVSAGACRRARTRADPPPSVGELGPFHLGQQRAARLRLRLRLALVDGPPQELLVTARWAATPSDIEGGAVALACELSDVEVHLTAGTGAPAAQARDRAERELAVALARPFYLAAGADGALAGAWFPADTSPAVVRVLSTAATAQQLVRPAGADGHAWVVRERDGSGAYLAAYREEGPGRVRKQKARYLPGPPAAAPVAGASRPVVSATPLVEQAAARFVTDAGGRVAEVEAHELLMVALGHGAPTLRLGTELSLTAPTTTQVPALVGAFRRDRPRLAWHPLEEAGPEDEAQLRARDRAVLGLDGPAELFGALGGGRERAGADLQRRFEALFRLQTGAAREAPAAVRAQPLARGKPVLDALALVGTAEAASALATVAKDAGAPADARRLTLVYLGQQARPTPAVVAALAGLLDAPEPSLRQGARLAYGACAHALRDTEPARAQRMVNDLLAHLPGAAAREARADLVAALGNAGSAQALPALRAAIDGPDAALRARAVVALRFIDDPEVDPLLLGLLARGRDPGLRRSALEAIRFRDAGPFAAALAEAARHDSEPSVRKAAITLIGDRVTTLPGLRAVLDEVLAIERQPASGGR